MECSAKAEPGRIRIVAQSANLRLPAVGQFLAVQTFRVTPSFAEDTRTLTPNTRGYQREGRTDDERIVSQRCWFPVVADTQKVLKGERRPGWGYAELLGSVFKICGERWKIRFERWQGDSCGNTCISRASTDSGDQQRSHEATPIELAHMAATPAFEERVELCSGSKPGRAPRYQ